MKETYTMRYTQKCRHTPTDSYTVRDTQTPAYTQRDTQTHKVRYTHRCSEIKTHTKSHTLRHKQIHKQIVRETHTNIRHTQTYLQG